MKRRKAARPPPSGAEDDDFDIVGPKAKKPQPAKKRESRIDRDLAQAIAESLCDSTFPHSATSDAPSMRCPSPLNEKLQAPSKAKPARSPARRPSAHQSPAPASLAPPAAPKKRTFHFVVHSDWLPLREKSTIEVPVSKKALGIAMKDDLFLLVGVPSEGSKDGWTIEGFGCLEQYTEGNKAVLTNCRWVFFDADRVIKTAKQNCIGTSQKDTQREVKELFCGVQWSGRKVTEKYIGFVENLYRISGDVDYVKTLTAPPQIAQPVPAASATLAKPAASDVDNTSILPQVHMDAQEPAKRCPDATEDDLDDFEDNRGPKPKRLQKKVPAATERVAPVCNVAPSHQPTPPPAAVPASQHRVLHNPEVPENDEPAAPLPALKAASAAPKKAVRKRKRIQDSDEDEDNGAAGSDTDPSAHSDDDDSEEDNELSENSESECSDTSEESDASDAKRHKRHQKKPPTKSKRAAPVNRKGPPATSTPVRNSTIARAPTVTPKVAAQHAAKLSAAVPSTPSSTTPSTQLTMPSQVQLTPTESSMSAITQGTQQRFCTPPSARSQAPGPVANPGRLAPGTAAARGKSPATPSTSGYDFKCGIRVSGLSKNYIASSPLTTPSPKPFSNKPRHLRMGLAKLPAGHKPLLSKK